LRPSHSSLANTQGIPHLERDFVGSILLTRTHQACLTCLQSLFGLRQSLLREEQAFSKVASLAAQRLNLHLHRPQLLLQPPLLVHMEQLLGLRDG
jgi:hypothetical protein